MFSSVSSYFGHLEGCGADLHKEIRDTYYQFVLFLVKAVKGFSSMNDRYRITAISRESVLPAFSDFRRNTCLVLKIWKNRVKKSCGP